MKNLLVFSDGTSNDTGGRADTPNPKLPGNSALSNVYRLYVAANPAHQQELDATRQVAFYDPGLGSVEEGEQNAQMRVTFSIPRWFRRQASKITGLGISQNIEDCYRFLVKHYKPGDRIFLIGFSRGAYTVRSLGGLLALVGILKGGQDLSAPLLNQKIKQAVSIYKIRDREEREARAAEVRDAYHAVVPHAVCVFDTVRALGVAGFTTKSIGALAERFAPHEFHDHLLHKEVPFAFQAVSIDENRRHFAVELWEPNPDATTKMEQRWFPGVHSDIGGSYRDGESGTGRDLGRMTLQWALDRLTQPEVGLLVNRSVLDLGDADDRARYPFGPLHNERRSRWWLPSNWPTATRDHASKATLEGAGAEGDLSAGVIDQRTAERFHADADYRPAALQSHPAFRSAYPEPTD